MPTFKPYAMLVVPEVSVTLDGMSSPSEFNEDAERIFVMSIVDITYPLITQASQVTDVNASAAPVAVGDARKRARRQRRLGGLQLSPTSQELKNEGDARIIVVPPSSPPRRRPSFGRRAAGSGVLVSFSLHAQVSLDLNAREHGKSTELDLSGEVQTMAVEKSSELVGLISTAVADEGTWNAVVQDAVEATTRTGDAYAVNPTALSADPTADITFNAEELTMMVCTTLNPCEFPSPAPTTPYPSPVPSPVPTWVAYPAPSAMPPYMLLAVALQAALLLGVFLRHRPSLAWFRVRLGLTTWEEITWQKAKVGVARLDPDVLESLFDSYSDAPPNATGENAEMAAAIAKAHRQSRMRKDQNATTGDLLVAKKIAFSRESAQALWEELTRGGGASEHINKEGLVNYVKTGANELTPQEIDAFVRGAKRTELKHWFEPSKQPVDRLHKELFEDLLQKLSLLAFEFEHPLSEMRQGISFHAAAAEIFRHINSRGDGWIDKTDIAVWRRMLPIGRSEALMVKAMLAGGEERKRLRDRARRREQREAERRKRWKQERCALRNRRRKSKTVFSFNRGSHHRDGGHDSDESSEDAQSETSFDFATFSWDDVLDTEDGGGGSGKERDRTECVNLEEFTKVVLHDRLLWAEVQAQNLLLAFMASLTGDDEDSDSDSGEEDDGTVASFMKAEDPDYHLAKKRPSMAERKESMTIRVEQRHSKEALVFAFQALAKIRLERVAEGWQALEEQEDRIASKIMAALDEDGDDHVDTQEMQSFLFKMTAATPTLYEVGLFMGYTERLVEQQAVAALTTEVEAASTFAEGAAAKLQQQEKIDKAEYQVKKMRQRIGSTTRAGTHDDELLEFGEIADAQDRAAASLPRGASKKSLTAVNQMSKRDLRHILKQPQHHGFSQLLQAQVASSEVLGPENESSGNTSNFVAIANSDDGSCTYPVLGCMSPSAANYDSTATLDIACRYVFYGCTDPVAINYVSSANTDDGSCIIPRPGCMAPVASNYDSLANEPGWRAWRRAP